MLYVIRLNSGYNLPATSYGSTISLQEIDNDDESDISSDEEGEEGEDGGEAFLASCSHIFSQLAKIYPATQACCSHLQRKAAPQEASKAGRRRRAGKLCRSWA